MKVELIIERGDGEPIARWEHETEQSGVEVTTSATMADYAMLEGVTTAQLHAAGIDRWLGVRFRARIAQ